MEGLVGDKLSGVMAALALSADAKIDLDIRLHFIICLYKNISITSQHLKHSTVTDTLKNIVLESGNDSDSNWKYFQLKRYAFGCLEKAATCCSNEFFQNYYSYLKEQLNIKLLEESRQQKTFLEKTIELLFFISTIFLNQDSSSEQCSTDVAAQPPEIKLLDGYFYTCEKTEKFRILKTLSIHIFDTACQLNLSIFEEFQSKHWCKELLTYTLLSNNTGWNVTQTSNLVRDITSLDIDLKEFHPTYCIENILELFITTQRKCGLDVGFITKMLTLLHNDESLNLICKDFCFLPDVFPQLELFQLKAICKEQQIIYNNQNEIKELLYLLVYSDKVVDKFLSKVKPKTPITKLIEFLKTVRNKNINRKEKFLLRLKRNRSIEDWHKEFSLPLIDSFIREEFPCQKYIKPLFTLTNHDKVYFTPNKSNSKIKPTTYSQLNLAKKIELRKRIKYNSPYLIENNVNADDLRDILHDLKKALSKLILMSDWCPIGTEFSESVFQDVKKLIGCLDSENKMIRLVNALEILLEYGINISQCNAMEIIFNSTESNVEKNICNFIIKRFFPGTYEKSVEQLIEESVSANRKENIKLLKNEKDLMAEYRKVMNAYNGKSPAFEEFDSIKNWGKHEIGRWSFFVKLAGTITKHTTAAKSLRLAFKQELPSVPDQIREGVLRHIISQISQHERIAVITRAMELTVKLKPREVQLLSILLFLNCEKDKGRLAQINTGEGKTVTIGMIAAYLALEGYQVDVITSSKLLAIPQSEELADFYDTLHLSVGHIFHPTYAYTDDVIYGTSNEFQGDILRDEFRKSRCRHGRKFEVAIVDEVDNMLVDGNNHIVLLSCQMPAMDHLDTLLAAIYAQMKVAAGSVIVRNGQSYFVERDSLFDEHGKVKKEVVENHIPIEGTMRDFIVNATELHIRNLIRDCKADSLSKDFPEIKIPKHLRELICKTQLKRWVHRSVASKFHYMIKEDYIMEDNRIKIVDAENTGVIQESMRWCDGLHQFLEIKHGTKVTPERLTSNFISNVSFFRRYQPKIYGLTGTLGCQATKDLLAKTYNLDFVVVPSFKFRQHEELTAIIVNNRNDWHREIVKSSLRKLCNGRAVLIIMEYIQETEAIEKIFLTEFGYDKNKVKLYKTDSDAAVVQKPLSCGQVIITTNIAGRGTDIKLTTDVDNNGGLHVCITFLPRNSRVEEQNIGRTSRTGNRGTSQLILCNSETDIERLRENRQQKEETSLKNAEKEIEIVTTKDEVFQKFCRLTDIIQSRNPYVREIEREAVEERFAIWLKMCTNKMEDDFNKSDFVKSFESFREEILRDDKNGKLIRNPYMFVRIGNKYLNDKDYKKAISEYSLAIAMDPDFAEHAHYNRGYAYVAEYGNDLTKYRAFINQAIDDFAEARRLIEEKEHYLHLMQHASQAELFINQISNKLSLYSIQKAAIDLAIGPDQKLLDQQIEECKKLRDDPKMKSSDREKILENIESLYAQKNSIGIIQKARASNRELKIETIELEECFVEDDQSHEDEIRQFKRNGAIGSFRISEIPPIDWLSVTSLLLLGIGQLIAGAALTIFSMGAGASIGIALITEGISDIVTAVKDGIINRDFSWATWALEKAISLTVSVVCAGWKAIKDVAKTAYAGAKSAASIGSKVLTQTVKEGWKLAAKKIAVELGKEVGKEMATQLSDYGVSQTVIPLIRQAIIEKVQGPIEKALENNRLVKMMLEIDGMRNNRHYENRIRTLGMDLLNPRSSKDLFELKAIAEKIANRIADKKIPGHTTVRTIQSALECVVELSTLTQKFIRKLNESLAEKAKKDKLEEQFKTISKSHNQEQVKKEESVSQKKEKKIHGDIDLNLLHEEEQQAKSRTLPKDTKGMSKNFVNVISTTMVHSIQQKLISPVIRAGVDYSVDSITSNVTKSLDKHTKIYKSHRHIIHRQNRGYRNVKTSDEQNSIEKKQRINKIEGLIEDLRSGGPAGLIHLGALSDAINMPINVYDKNGKLKYTIGETKPGRPAKIEYHEPRFGEEFGHYTLPNNKEPTGKISKDRNMCIFNVLAVQVGSDPNDLRDSTLQIMENNKSSMVKQVDDINRLEMFSNLRLAMGGARYQGKCPDDAEEYLKNSTNAKAFNINQPGHPLRHTPYQGTTEQKLEEMSKELKRKIVVYDEKGDISYSKGDNFEGEPMKLVHHKSPGDTSSEYFSSKGGNEPPYRLHDPSDKNLYKIVGKLAKHDPEKLMSSVTNNIRQRPIPDNTVCVEDYSIGYSNPNGPTGFVSQADMNFVTHHVLQLDSTKKAMERLNNLNLDKKLSAKQCREVLIIPAKDLGVSRPIYAQNWVKGQPTGSVKEAKQFVILLQHHEGKEGDPDAPVHIHTIYPKF